MSDDAHEADPSSADKAGTREEARRSAEREDLLSKRRARQTGLGKDPRSVRRIMFFALLAACAAVFLVVLSPTAALRILGYAGDGQRTSQVNMEVDKDKDEPAALDFGVPAKPESVKKEADPNVAWSEKFKALQDKLAEMERNKQPGVSTSEIQKMLSSYNESMTRKLEHERKAMAEENARLQAEAQRAEEERKRAEELAKLDAANSKENQKIEKMQRESEAVIVDEKNGTAGETADGVSTEDLNQNERFLKSSASSVEQTSVSQRLRDPSRMVVQGTIISAVLESAIDTELPGSIRAQVMQPVYSFDGTRVLMPSGTVLIGQFNDDVGIAQKRVLIAWNRAITPDGKSIALGSIGTDRLGRSGTTGNVDNRYGTKFGAAMLISAITAVPTLLSSQGGGGRSGTSGGTNISVGGQLSGDMGGSVSEQTSGALDKYLTLPPVIRIPQGEEIRIFVNRDLLFK